MAAAPLKSVEDAPEPTYGELAESMGFEREVNARMAFSRALDKLRKAVGEPAVEATLDALPDNTTQVGFYSYGELSPFGVGSCDLHNQTMTLTTVTER